MEIMIPIPLEIPNIEVKNVEIKKAKEIIVTVESTINGATCEQCGKETTEAHGSDRAILLRHLSAIGHRVYIKIEPKRYKRRNCPKSPTITQKLEWCESRSQITKAYEEHILLELVNSTIQDVSLKEGIGYDAIEGIINRRISSKVDWSKYQSLPVMGLDEIALKKGTKIS